MKLYVSYAQNTSVTQCISALSFHCLLRLCLPWRAAKNYTVSCLSNYSFTITRNLTATTKIAKLATKRIKGQNFKPMFSPPDTDRKHYCVQKEYS